MQSNIETIGYELCDLLGFPVKVVNGVMSGSGLFHDPTSGMEYTWEIVKSMSTSKATYVLVKGLGSLRMVVSISHDKSVVYLIDASKGSGLLDSLFSKSSSDFDQLVKVMAAEYYVWHKSFSTSKWELMSNA